MISKCLRDKVFPLEDKDLLRDRQKFILHNFDYDQYKSNDIEDRRYIFHQDLRTICILIGQLILFKRIILTNKEGIPYLPKGFVPQHLNPLKKGSFDKKTLEEMLNDLRLDEIYEDIEDVINEVEMIEGKDMPLEMVRGLNILNNDIDNAVYKKQIEFGKKYPKVRDKIIQASKYLQKLVRKMR